MRAGFRDSVPPPYGRGELPGKRAAGHVDNRHTASGQPGAQRLCHDLKMDTDPASSAVPPPLRRSRLRFAAMVLVGLLAAGATGIAGHWVQAPTIGWCAAALTYIVWVWLVIGRLDAADTRLHATTEDPARSTTDLLILAGNVASLAAAAAVIVGFAQQHRHRFQDCRRPARGGLGGTVLDAGPDALHAALRGALLRHGHEGRLRGGRHRLQPEPSRRSTPTSPTWPQALA